MKELISVVVPIYNSKNYTKKCIESLMKQTYQNLEIILIDDGSSDGSDEICDMYAKVDKRLKVIHKKNEGRCVARNIGIDYANGDYIGFVDGDDYLEEDMYEVLYNLLTEYQADISMISYFDIKEESKTPRYNLNEICIYDNVEAMKELLLDKKIQSYLWNKLFKKELFRELRLEDLSNLEDVDFIYKIFMRMKWLVYLPIPKYNYVFRKDSGLRSISAQKFHVALEVVVNRFYVIEKYYPMLEFYNFYGLIMWMVRLYTFCIQNDIEIDF